MSDACFWSVEETASRLRRREISVAELTAAHLARIEEVNPAINAITTPVREAMATARALDEAGMPEDAGPLWGVPVTTKINVDQKGYPNSTGVSAFKDAVADADSPVVANLKAAGAVIVGRTNTPEFSMRWFTSNALHGVTRNPWDPTLTPGGSSGAAAAAVACGIGAVAHGNDLGGSLRCPAYCCGVATIRPSLGAVPAMNPTQSAAGIERGPLTQLMAVQGPIARCVADVRAGLDVMARGDIRDPLWVPLAPGRSDGGGTITVGFAINPFGGALDPAVEAAMTTALEALRDAGSAVREVAPPYAAELPSLWGTLLFTETEALVRASIEEHGTSEMRRYYADFAACFETADAKGLLQAMQRRIVRQRAWAQMFKEIDALLMPTSLRRLFANDADFEHPERLAEIVAAQAPLLAVNVLGLPSVALPTHLDDGAPQGVQLIGRMRDDAFVLDVAERLERELGVLWRVLKSPAATWRGARGKDRR